MDASMSEWKRVLQLYHSSKRQMWDLTTRIFHLNARNPGSGPIRLYSPSNTTRWSDLRLKASFKMMWPYANFGIMANKLCMHFLGCFDGWHSWNIPTWTTITTYTTNHKKCFDHVPMNWFHCVYCDLVAERLKNNRVRGSNHNPSPSIVYGSSWKAISNVAIKQTNTSISKWDSSQIRCN